MSDELKRNAEYWLEAAQTLVAGDPGAMAEAQVQAIVALAQAALIQAAQLGRIADVLEAQERDRQADLERQELGR